MEFPSPSCEFQRLNRDLLSDIIARLDGSSVAAAACACSDVRDVAQDQSLWQQLCHSTWPSTALEEAQSLISSSSIGGFNKFYADSYPLVLYDDITRDTTGNQVCPGLRTCAWPSDFVSLIDIYYKKKCILSRVVDGIPEAVDVYNDPECNWDETSNDHQMWFSNCPFKLDVLISKSGTAIGDNDDDAAASNRHQNLRNLPCFSNAEGRWRGDFCKELEDLRLSWVLFDKKKGKAVNLSSWKPLLVQRSWHSGMDYMLRFGCIVPMDEHLLPHKLAECVILVKCMLTEGGGPVMWREISMNVEDMAGAPLSGRKSLMVLNRALYCLRSKNHLELEEGYRRFEREKREIKRRKELREALADRLCISIEIAVFITFCYACTIFF